MTSRQKLCLGEMLGHCGGRCAHGGCGHGGGRKKRPEPNRKGSAFHRCQLGIDDAKF